MRNLIGILTFVLALGFTTSTVTAETYKDEKIDPVDTKSEQTAVSNTYVVKSGDSLSTISKKHYNTEDYWKLIADENGINSPYSLDVGEKLILPEVDKTIAKVTEREVVGKIVNFDLDKKMIDVEDEEGNKHTFHLDENIKVKYTEDGKALSVEAVNK